MSFLPDDIIGVISSHLDDESRLTFYFVSKAFRHALIKNSSLEEQTHIMRSLSLKIRLDQGK